MVLLPEQELRGPSSLSCYFHDDVVESIRYKKGSYFSENSARWGCGLGSGRPGFGFGLPRQAPDLTF